MRDVRPLLLAATFLALVAAPARAQEPQRLSLADAIRIASSTAPQVALAELREREARTKVGQARAAFLPSVGGAAYENERTFNRLTTGFDFPSLPGTAPFPIILGPVKSYDARVKASQTLFDGASWARLGAARTGVQVSVAERRGTAEAAAQGAALAYLHRARAGAQLAARRADEALADTLAHLATQQERAGVTPHIDAVRARTQYVAALGERVVAENQVDQADITLARALGIDPTTRFALADTMMETLSAPGVVSDSLAGALAQAQARRPELDAERARLARAESERRATSLERLPRVDVSGDWGPSGVQLADATPTRQWTVAVSVPLLDGLRRESRLAEQGALIRESQVRLHDLQSQLTAEVAGALLDIANGERQQEVAVERLALADQEVAEARERFAQGVANNIEVIDAQSSLVRARDALIEARHATAVGRLELARATGDVLSLR